MKSLRKKALGTSLLAAGLLTTGSALAGATIKVDDTKWISVGAGIRSSFSAGDNAAGAASDKWSSSFALDNVRLYVNGQVHENIKFEFNTEVNNTGALNSSTAANIFVLDAIAKFEFTDLINVWAGRLLVPSDRAELDGPFYQNTYAFNKTPFFPNDQFNSSAGRYGRDDGVVLWGALTADKRLTYSVGVFDGAYTTVNQDDDLLYAGRVSYNFLNVEQNPGYYTSSTYYGNAGDILTVAFATQYQEDGVGDATNAADFWGMSADILSETVLASGGVVTAEAQWKRFELTGFVNDGTGNNLNNVFEGDAYTGTLLYLMPGEIGIGRVQPYVRYTNNNGTTTANTAEWEGGLNYIIDGQNAKISAWYTHGDISTTGRNYLTTSVGDEQSTVNMAVQLQF
ncbi:MAG: OprO/OprP family phosphate-selective porin [Methylococcales bacterium]|nr:OprO/OprP family phosphate-selective porin [Methylococcales bacterium]